MPKIYDKGKAFELRVKELLEQHGFRVERDVLIAGNQVDLVARRSVGPVPELFVVECKAHDRPVGVNYVNVFIGEVATAQQRDPRVRGIFVSSEGFTKAAKCSAATAGVTCLTAPELEKGMPSEMDFGAAVSRYNQHVVDRYGRLTLYNLKTEAPLSLELERVYVRQTAVEQVRHCGPLRECEEKKTGWNKRSLGQEIILERFLSVQELLAEDPRLVIIGAPGAGKTTLLEWLALTFARDLAGERLELEERRVPVFVPLRTFGKYLGDHPDRFEPTPDCLLNFLDHHFGGWHLDLPSGFFARLAEEGQATFLFDGLDEVADPGRRADVVRAVEALVARYGENRYIVTTRPAGHTGLALFGVDFRRCDIRPFSDEDVEAFVDNWYLAVETASGDNLAARRKAADGATDLLERIRENDRIRRLVYTPLLLAVVALVHQNRTTLPQRRVELYDECTHMLLGFWDEQKGGEAARELAQQGDLDRYKKRAIMGPIALRFHEREAQEVEGEELRKWLRQEFETLGTPQPERRAELFLRVIQERAGLLMESEPDIYRWSHFTFQEYLAARAAADRDDYIDYAMVHRHDPWWQEVILLEVGHLSAPCSRRARRLTTDLVQAIWKAESKDPLEQDIERILRRNLLLAGRCLAELGSTEVEETVRSGVVAELGELFRTTSYNRLRDEVARVLAGMGGSGSAEQAAAELTQALTNAEDEQVRQTAAFSLGLLGNATLEIAQALIAALADTIPYVRWTAASSLGRLGRTSPWIVAALITALADAIPYVRLKAARSLVQLGRTDSEVTKALIPVLTHPAPDVRRTAAISLGQLSQATPDTVRALITALATDVDPYVQGKAATSLGQLGQASHEVIQALIAALANVNEDVRWTVAASLVQLSHANPETVQALIIILASAAPSVRRAIVASLGQIGQATPDVVQSLTGALVDADLDVRQAAIVSLGQLGQATPSIVQALLKVLINNSSPQIRQAAAGSLGQIGHTTSDVIQAMIATITSDSSAQVRQAAAASLGELQRPLPDVVHTLIAALSDTSPDVRQAAAASAGRLGHTNASVIQSLVAGLIDPDPGVCQAASTNLIQLSHVAPKAVQILIDIISGTDNVQMRQAVIAVLGQLGQSTSSLLQTLDATLTDVNEALRLTAAASLVQLGHTTPNVKQVLINALASASEDIRQTAIANLGKLTQAPPNVIQAVIDTLTDAAEDVRLTAAASLGQLGQPTHSVVQALTKSLTDTEWPVRRAAATSLGQLNQATPDVAVALISALADVEWSVRRAAATSLGRLGEATLNVIQALVYALSDTDMDVSQTAATSLIQLAAVDERQILSILISDLCIPDFTEHVTLGVPAYEYVFDVLWTIKQSRGL